MNSTWTFQTSKDCATVSLNLLALTWIHITISLNTWPTLIPRIGLNWIVWVCVVWSHVEPHIRYVQSKFGLYKRLQGTLIVTWLVVLGYSTHDDRRIPKLIAKKRKILQILQYLTIIDKTTPKRAITYFVISYARWPNYRMN